MTKNNWVVIGIILFLLIGLIAIANRNSTPAPAVINDGEENVVPAPTPTQVAYGDFTLSLGQTALLPEGSFKVISVDEDSRCPIDVQCIWAGRLVTTVEYSVDGVSKRETLELNKSIVRGSERITLVEVSPNPKAGVEISDSDYKFTFRAVKTTAAQPTTPPSPTSGQVVSGGCFVGGCSGQICSDKPGAISTCEFREEYACYRTARCERQTNGQCGWTETAALQMCLANAR